MTAPNPSHDGPYAQLHALLATDPENAALLADTAEAAYAEGHYDQATALIARYAAREELPPELRHLGGLIALGRQDWSAAIDAFEQLRAAGTDAPAIRFNLAWSLAMMARKDEALALLDDAVVDTVAAAAQLKVGLLHESGRLDEALEVAKTALDLFPDHRGLNAVVSTLAIDAEDVELARATAGRAGDHPDAMTTSATLALGDEDVMTAERLFGAVLDRDSDNPRARVGLGLVALLKNDPGSAVAELDRGAELFATHPGSWLAAGWAHLIAGDTAAARVRFERALAIDDSFAEAQGSLAVISLTAGDVTDARRRTEIALRLDRESFAGALGAAMLASGTGDAAEARRIVTLALETPLDDQGRTIAQMLARSAAGG